MRNKQAGRDEQGSTASGQASWKGWAKRAPLWFGALVGVASIAGIVALLLHRVAPVLHLQTPQTSEPIPYVARAGHPVGQPGQAPAPLPSKRDVREQLLSMPLRFERNEGQFDADIRYLARAEGLTLALADDGPTLFLPASPAPSADVDDDEEAESESQGPQEEGFA